MEDDERQTFNADNVKLDKNKIITLNFRGTNVQFHRKYLSKFPNDSPFRKYLKSTYNLDLWELGNDATQKMDILVNRNASLFNNLLDYFDSGELHFPHCICLDVIQNEMYYWGLASHQLAGCCLDRLLLEKEDHEHKQNIGKEWNKMNKADQLTHLHTASFHDMTPVNSSGKLVRSLGKGKLGQKMKCAKFYHVLNNPGSCILAKVIAGVVICTTILSVLLLSIEAETFAREPSYKTLSTQFYNQSGGDGIVGIVEYYFKHSSPKNWIFIVDVILTAVLTVEFLARFALSEKKGRFLCQPLSVADLLSVLPVWVSLVLHIYVDSRGNEENSLLVKLGFYIAFLRALRIFRVGHIALHNKKLRVVFLALKCSWRELLILFTLIGINSFFYGIFMFFVEIWTEDTFSSVFEAQWWAIITMTTVGYGDFCPKSAAGRLVGVVCSLTGIVVVAMATSVLVNNFLTIYRYVEKLERIETICQLKKTNGNSNSKVLL